MRDLLSLAGAAVAICLSALGKDPYFSIPLLILFFLFTIWRWWLTFQSREAKNTLTLETAAGLFRFMNRELFNDTNLTRFTLFQLSAGRMIPVVRYFKGCTDPIRDAERSRCSYTIGQGITGTAWTAGDDEVDVQTFPSFDNRRTLMDAYYIDILKIPKKTVEKISDHMVTVRGILSYPLRDAHGKGIGLISIDLRGDSVDFNREDAIIVVEPSSDASPQLSLFVSHGELLLFGRITANVLESMEVSKRRTTYE